LLVCGPADVSDEIANGLSKSRLFLQHPSYVPISMVYHNPQYMVINHASLPNGSFLAPISIEEFQLPSSQENLTISSNVSEDVDVLGVLNDFSQQEYSSIISLDPCIKTELLV
jgi:hypothetical protein